MSNRFLVIRTCHQCRFGESRIDTSKIYYDAWCWEANRRLRNLNEIPSWCPLPLVHNLKKEANK